MSKIKKAVALCCVLLLFVGCQSTPRGVGIAYPFACDVTVKLEDMTLQGRWEASLIGCYKMTVKEPEAWQGLAFSCQNGKTTLTLCDITYDVPDSLPEMSFFAMLSAALDQVAYAEHPDHTSKTTAVYQGRIASGSYSVEVDKATRRPLRFYTEQGVEIEMSYN